MRIALLLVIASLAGACGGGATSPTSPSASTDAPLLTPSLLVIAGQKVNATNNDVQLSWSGNGASYQLIIGTVSGASDLLNATVTGTTYTWTSPRASGPYYVRVAGKRGDAMGPYSEELSVVVVDLRNVIDAMYFHAGPMSDTPSNAAANPVAGVWADGTRLRVLVSNDLGETARANAQTFADQYAALMGGAVTATAELTSTTFRSVDYTTLPEFTVALRVQTGVCPEAALACAVYGPQPIGPNRSMITFPTAGGLNLSATAHEMGHAYGMGHVLIPVTGRPEFRFMMHTSASSEQMTEIEKLAVSVARSSGVRAGMTRSQALAAGIVNPFTGTSSISRLGVSGVGAEQRDEHGWILVASRTR